MNYSFRKKNKIVKYIIIHYTGMKNLKLAYQKLSNSNSKVSAHYLISRKGIIYNLLCPKLKAWHAGKSSWKNYVNINDLSIGIELENKGHEFGYSNFTNKQYTSLSNVIFFLKNNFYIKDYDILYHSDIAPNRKKDPGEKFYLKKVGIRRLSYNNKYKKKYNINEMLILYGFNKTYIKNYKQYCIKSVKRTLNYKKITTSVSNKFMNDFYNLLFH